MRPVTAVIDGLTRAPLLILLAAVSLVLLIACANVANLLIARGQNRQQELALRAALGAGSGRLVRQVLTENLTLAALGGAAGIGLAYLSMRALRQLTAEAMPFTLAPQLDLRVLTFSLVLTLATGLLCGLLPALRVRKPDLNVTLNDGGKRATAGRRHRTQSVLVVGEVALTLILLASAGLLLRSLAKVTTTDPGFQAERLLAFDVSLPGTTYGSPEKRLQFALRLLGRLRSLPGVGGVGTGMAVPFSGGGYGEYFMREGRTDERDVVTGRLDFVSPGYLEALGPRLLAGRRLTNADNRPNGPRVAVISETAAEHFFPETDPIGRELLIASDPWRIVGIVADVVDRRLDAPPKPFAYVPQALDTSVLSTGFSVIIRTPLDPLALVPGVHDELRRLDPGVALANPRALDQALAGSITERRVVLTLIALFAGAALLLACIGLYGVLAYAVATRRREIGVRMALGAARGDVIRHVVRGALSMVAIGLLIGLAGALGAARLLASELYHVRGYDPLVLTGAVLTITIVALAASAAPAWKASRVSPATALRAD